MRVFWVGVGGAFGSMARYVVDGWVQAAFGTSFPYGTLAVNVAGSFLLGLIMHVAATMGGLGSTLRIGLTAGVLGGFTTYSTFNYETLQYAREGAWALATLNIGVTLAACLLAGAAGVAVGRALWG